LNNANVTSALSTLTTLSSTFAAKGGASLNLSVSSNQTLDPTGATGSFGAATYDAATNNYYYNLSNFNMGGGTLTIDGTNMLAAHPGAGLVFNDALASNANFNSNIVLTGGLTPDQVLFNFTSSGKQISTSGASTNISALILALNDTLPLDGANVTGRIFGGDSDTNLQVVSGFSLTQPSGSPGPGIAPEPSSLSLVLGIGGLAILGYRWRRRRSG
jgi:hypothetical protein